MNPCDRMGEWISASLDGELDSAQQGQLDRHLASCPECSQRQKAFHQVDRLVRRVDVHIDPSQQLKVNTRQQASRRQARYRKMWHMGWAAAALVVVTVGLFVLSAGQRVDASSSLAEPVATIEVINRQMQRDHHVLLKTCEWDLRGLKLELDCLDLEADEARRLNQRIEDLLARVQQVNDQ